MQVDPGKPSEDARLLNLAMKAILVVAIVSIMGAAIVAVISQPIYFIGSDDSDAEPNVAFARAEAIGGGQWMVQVAGVSNARDLEDFKAILLKNGTIEDEMDPLTEVSTTRMSFTDLGGDDKLNSGDFFTITCDSGSNYKLSILWKDSGNERGRSLWET